MRHTREFCLTIGLFLKLLIKLTQHQVFLQKTTTHTRETPSMLCMVGAGINSSDGAARDKGIVSPCQG